MTYGAYVAKLLREANDNDPEIVNCQLEKLGHGMGMKMADEFFARQSTPQAQCKDFRTTVDIISKQAFRVFLNITAEVEKYDEKSKGCFLVFRENPFAEFVVLPNSCVSTLWYSNVICGMIRGALEAVGIIVEAYFERDVLRGDDATVVRLKFIKVLKAKDDIKNEE